MSSGGGLFLRGLAGMNSAAAQFLCAPPNTFQQTKTLLLEGPSFILLFAFEYLILTCTVASTFLKYLIYVIDMRRHGRWPSKPVFSFYLNLITDLTQASLYLNLPALCAFHRLPCVLLLSCH
jgi:hypothetical protein